MEKKKRYWLKENIIYLLFIFFGMIFSVTMGVLTRDTTSPQQNINSMVKSESLSETSTELTTETQKELVNPDEFFRDSVFVGDSVMYGFEKYITRKGEDFLGNPKFLTIGNFAVRLNLEPISNQSTHPFYKGTKCTIEQAVMLMEAKKVFLFFGLNDIAISGIDKTVENYYNCIQKIREKSPDVQIYILSATYIASGSEKSYLNNDNIRILNQQLEGNSTTWGVGYIDIATYLSDNQGCLAAQYCSDGYVHLNESAYDIWVQVLRNYALTKY